MTDARSRRGVRQRGRATSVLLGHRTRRRSDRRRLGLDSLAGLHRLIGLDRLAGLRRLRRLIERRRVEAEGGPRRRVDLAVLGKTVCPLEGTDRAARRR